MTRPLSWLRSVSTVSILSTLLFAAPNAFAAIGGPDTSSRTYAGTVRPQASTREPQVALELFGAAPLRFERVTTFDTERATTWVGALDDDPHGRLFLTHLDGIAFGEAHAYGRIYEILGIGETWEVAEIEPASGVCATGSERDETTPSKTSSKSAMMKRAPVKNARSYEPVAPLDTKSMIARKNTTRAPTSLTKAVAATSKYDGLTRKKGRRFMAEAHDPSYVYARVDVLGLYTEGARSSAWQSLSPDDKAHLEAYVGQIEGGRIAMEARIENQVAKANDAFAQSGVIVRLGLVHMAEIEKPGTATDIVALRNWLGLEATLPGRDIRNLRDTHDADLVSLFDRNTGSDGEYCGMAYTLGPWPGSIAVVNVVDYDCMAKPTFAHEIGHSFGAAHDRYAVEEQYAEENAANGTNHDPDDAGLFDYSYGYVHAPEHRTIMSYDWECPSCPRIARFSNPDLPYGGFPTGVVGEADNARTINRSWYYVSRQRPDLGLPPPPTP